MLLSDRGILGAMAKKSLSIDPFDGSLLQPASIDLRLGREICVQLGTPDWVTRNPEAGSAPMDLHLLDIDGPYTLSPREFVLAHTLEVIGLDASLAGRVEGKSSLGRMGLLVVCTAGFIDPGFRGQITLELSNLSNCALELREGMAIGQLCVMKMESPALRPYGHQALGSRYQGQMGATLARSKK